MTADIQGRALAMLNRFAQADWPDRLKLRKPSGKFLPGHGGALDRFDAFLFGCILMWALAQIWPMTQAPAAAIATPF